jgi:hypothetical protein
MLPSINNMDRSEQKAFDRNRKMRGEAAATQWTGKRRYKCKTRDTDMNAQTMQCLRATAVPLRPHGGRRAQSFFSG